MDPLTSEPGAAVRNVHARRIAVPAHRVGEVLDTLASRDDRLWPREHWPRMRFDRPLGVGAVGGHGPVGYVVEAYEPGRSVAFRFTRPAGFHGHHAFHVEDTGGDYCVLRHELVMDPRGSARITWPLFFRPLHDALIEEGFDKAERALTSRPVEPTPRSRWVRMLRAVLSRAGVGGG